MVRIPLTPPQGYVLWLLGGAGAVQYLCREFYCSSGVKGHVELYDLDPAGNERLLQTKAITYQAFTM